jgi:tetratricopeptide (TPR) repeat protein
MTEALLMNVRTAYDRGQPGDPEKLEMLEFSLGQAGDTPALRARLLGALAVESIFVADGPARAPLLDEARALACRSGDLRALIDVATDTFVARSRASWSARQFAVDRSLFDQAREAARRLADPVWVAATEAQAAFIAFMAGDGELLRAGGDTLAEVSEGGQNQVAVRSHLRIGQSIATLDGRLADADTLSAEVSETWPVTATAEPDAARALAQIPLRREQDRLAELIGALATNVTSPASAAVPAAAAFALLETGQRDDAAIALHRADAAGFGTIPDDVDWPVAVALWSEVAARTGDRHAAAELYQILRPHDGLQMCSGPAGYGPTARLLALLETLLGRPDDADRHFAEAVAFSRRLMSPVWTARCQLEWAQTRFDRGQLAEASELTDDADHAAGEFALPALCRQWTALRDQLDQA